MTTQQRQRVKLTWDGTGPGDQRLLEVFGGAKRLRSVHLAPWQYDDVLRLLSTRDFSAVGQQTFRGLGPDGTTQVVQREVRLWQRDIAADLAAENERLLADLMDLESGTEFFFLDSQGRAD